MSSDSEPQKQIVYFIKSFFDIFSIFSLGVFFTFLISYVLISRKYGYSKRKLMHFGSKGPDQLFFKKSAGHRRTDVLGVLRCEEYDAIRKN